MRISSHNITGNIHEATAWVNKFSLANVFHSFHPVSSGHTIVILKYESYSSYLYVCSKLGLDALPVEEYFESTK